MQLNSHSPPYFIVKWKLPNLTIFYALFPCKTKQGQMLFSISTHFHLNFSLQLNIHLNIVDSVKLWTLYIQEYKPMSVKRVECVMLGPRRGGPVGRDPACKHKVPCSSRGRYCVGGGFLACIVPFLPALLGC